MFQYVFFVAAKAQDGDMLARPVNVTVIVEDINDNPPVCDNALTKFEVQENEDIGKKALHQMLATAPNAIKEGVFGFKGATRI